MPIAEVSLPPLPRAPPAPSNVTSALSSRGGGGSESESRGRVTFNKRAELSRASSARARTHARPDPEFIAGVHKPATRFPPAISLGFAHLRATDTRARHRPGMRRGAREGRRNDSLRFNAIIENALFLTDTRDFVRAAVPEEVRNRPCAILRARASRLIPEFPNYGHRSLLRFKIRKKTHTHTHAPAIRLPESQRGDDAECNWDGFLRNTDRVSTAASSRDGFFSARRALR